ncbi:MAG TPA: hypothetical protein VF668_19990 [Pyrinomonadaceae bacterium]|jgi:hypothetical protein
MQVTPSPSARLLSRLCLAALCALGARPAGAAPRAADARAQESRDEKEARTPAQRKIDSQLLYALYERRGERGRRGAPKSDVEVDGRGRVLVDVRARVSRALLARVRRLGGEVVSSSESYHTVIARFPLERLEALAGHPDVRFIGPAARATTH